MSKTFWKATLASTAAAAGLILAANRTKWGRKFFKGAAQ